MKQVKTEQKVPYTEQCELCNVSYKAFLSWRCRAQRGEAVLKTPGPKVVEPLDLDALRGDLRSLPRGPKRMLGTTELYSKVKGGISRRDFYRLKSQVHSELNAQTKALKRVVEWRTPGLVWAMDDTELGRVAGGKVFAHTQRDQASRYVLPTPVGDLICGEELAGLIAARFDEHGAPLVFKRDNGGNLNHHAVNEVLAHYGVIPLNSPTYYPPYNGGVERAQSEVKKALFEMEGYDLELPFEHQEAFARAAVHDLNHKARRVLNGTNACVSFYSRKACVRYNRRQRAAIYEQLLETQAAILDDMNEPTKKARAAAWRFTVENYLQRHGHIFVHQPREVLPPFTPKNSGE